MDTHRQHVKRMQEIRERHEERMAHIDTVSDYNMRVINVSWAIVLLIILAAVAAWAVTGNYLWANASLIAPIVVLIAPTIFKKDYD